MKRLFAILALSTMFSMSGLKAQDTSLMPTNSVYFSYGQGSMYQFASILGAVLAEAFTAGHADIEDVRTSGSFTLGYTHAVKKWLWLGGELSYENIAFMSSKDQKKRISDRANSFCLMGACKMNWFDKQHFAMYSKVCAGASMMPANDAKTSFGFAFQLSPICLEGGGLNLRGFMEAGWGMQSFVAAGIRYRF